MSATDCQHTTTRKHVPVPCERPGVALRYDDEGNPYPVCKHHSAGFMVPLAMVLGTGWKQGHDQTCSHSCSTYVGLGERCLNPYGPTS